MTVPRYIIGNWKVHGDCALQVVAALPDRYEGPADCRL